MSLSRCMECETIEGEWRLLRGSAEAMAAAGLDADDSIEECCECGGQDCRQEIPEHDDYDLER